MDQWNSLGNFHIPWLTKYKSNGEKGDLKLETLGILLWGRQNLDTMNEMEFVVLREWGIWASLRIFLFPRCYAPLDSPPNYFIYIVRARIQLWQPNRDNEIK